MIRIIAIAMIFAGSAIADRHLYKMYDLSGENMQSFDPSAYAGLSLLLDCSVPSSLLTDGTYITNWLDRSGMGNHAFQTNILGGGSQGIGSAPMLTTNATGKVGLQFGFVAARPTYQYELILPSLQSGSQSNWTVFAVVQVTGNQPSNKGTVIGANSAGYASGGQIIALQNTVTNLQFDSSYRAVNASIYRATGNAGDISTDTVVLASRLNMGANEITIFQNGMNISSNALSRPLWNAGSSSAWRIGMSAESGLTHFEGIVFEIWHYTEALPDTVILEGIKYLEEKW